MVLRCTEKFNLIFNGGENEINTEFFYDIWEKLFSKRLDPKLQASQASYTLVIPWNNSYFIILICSKLFYLNVSAH